MNDMVPRREAAQPAQARAAHGGDAPAAEEGAHGAAPMVAAPAPDPVNPGHYRQHPAGVECIDVTEAMGFNLGNAVKCLWRAGLKGDPQVDLRKARWNIQRERTRRALGKPGPSARPVTVACEHEAAFAAFPDPLATTLKLLWWSDVDGSAVRLLDAADAGVATMMQAGESRP